MESIKRCGLVLMVVLTGSIGLFAKNEPDIQNELRAVGHEFLLNLNDSTSRVLPIKESKGKYIMTFESDFSFDPEVLVALMLEKVKQKEIRNYNVQVKNCISEDIQYSFTTLTSDKPDQIACAGRKMPASCYAFTFTPVPEKPTSSSGKGHLWWIVALVSTSFLGYFLYTRSTTKPPVVSDKIRIGDYIFDDLKMLLYNAEENITLSGKENELLRQLHQHKNETVSREDLLDAVWDDDGNYVGRTLDVYISKLRKKLSNDQNLKIINVRGVGYKLLVDD